MTAGEDLTREDVDKLVAAAHASARRANKKTGDRVEIERPASPNALETETVWVPGTITDMDGTRPVVRTDDGYLYDSCDPKHVRAIT